LAGIDPTGAGYGTLTVAPQVLPSLNHVAASIDTVRGPVASSWAVDRTAFTLDVTIPVNATAVVSMPLFGHGSNSVTADHHATLLRIEGDTAMYAVGSGQWQFITHL